VWGERRSPRLTNRYAGVAEPLRVFVNGQPVTGPDVLILHTHDETALVHHANPSQIPTPVAGTICNDRGATRSSMTGAAKT